MNKLFVKIFCFTLPLFIFACAGDKTTSAGEVIEKAIAAYGGETNLRNIKSKKETGTTIIYLQDTVFRTSKYLELFKSPNKSYYESPVNKPLVSPKLIFASNGTIAWTQNDGAYAPYLQPQEEIIDRKGEDYPYLFTLEERNVVVSYIQTIKENNQSLHLLRYTSKGGFEEDVYFDGETGLISKTYKKIQTSIGAAEVIQLFNDYRKVGDVMIPFRVESRYPPKEVNLNIINELEINTYLNDSLFDFPKMDRLLPEEIESLIGSYSNANTSLKISKSGDILKVEKDEQGASELLIVRKDFFMFRIGKKEKSHVENISVLKKERKDVQSLNLFYKGSEEVLLKEEPKK